MKDFELPPKLYMARKTFEFETDTRDESNIKTLSDRLLNQNSFSNSSNNCTISLEHFWARQHAYYIELCRNKNKKYSEFLPGRLYTYLLLKELILRICGRKQTRVLEAGCGSALTSSLLSLAGKAVFSVDIVMSALKFAEEMASDFGTQFKTVLADCINLPFKSNFFDIVFSLGLLEHKSHKTQKAIFDELVRVCKNWIIILIPNTRSPIYKFMGDLEFIRMPKELIYPEEHFLYAIDFDRILQNKHVYKYESSAIHVVPPKVIPKKYLTDESYNFFSETAHRALNAWRGNVINTWYAVESEVDDKIKALYGWFSYIICRKKSKQKRKLD